MQTRFMTQLKTLVGIPSSQTETLDPTEAAFRQFKQSLENPFIAARKRIIRVCDTLEGDILRNHHTSFDQSLRQLLRDLTLYNSNVSRFVITPTLSQLEHTPLIARKNIKERIKVKTLHKKHNQSYIRLRDICKDLLRTCPLAISEGDGDVIVESGQRVAMAAHEQIKLEMKHLNLIWAALRPYEDKTYATKD